MMEIHIAIGIFKKKKPARPSLLLKPLRALSGMLTGPLNPKDFWYKFQNGVNWDDRFHIFVHSSCKCI